MKKVTIEYEMPEDEGEMRCAIFAIDINLAVSDLLNYLRQIIKYDQDGLDANTAEKIRDYLVECLTDRGICLDWIE